MRLPLGSLAVLLALSTACASGAAGGATDTPGASRQRQDRNVLTREQLLETGHGNALEAVRALRSNWLLTKGTDSFNSPTQVQVYLDDNQYGGVDSLRGIAIQQIKFIRYYDGVSASARWGLGHGQGVIYVSTAP
jgi:hypothetical protein